MFTEQMTQRQAMVGYIAPSNHQANTDTTVAGIDMRALRRLRSYLQVGVLGTNANVQMFYYSSANSNMAGSTNLGNSASFDTTTTSLTGTTNGRVETLEVRADQLPAGHRYVQPVVITNTAASFWGLMCIAEEGSYKPENQFNVANIVDQALVMKVV